MARSPRAARAYLLAALLGLGCRDDGPAADADLAGADLAGADLAGADLAGADLAGPLVLGTTSAVQVIVEPGDSGAAMLAAINGAATSVHMTMYLLSASSVVNALIARKQAGKEVKVLLNKTFPSGGGSNASVFGQLQGAGVEVRYAPSGFQYTHEKSIVVDGTSVWIMTMNAAASAFTDNREFLAVDSDAADVAEAEAIFQGDWAGTPVAPAGKLLTAPDNAEGRVIALVDQATQTVDLEGEVLSAQSILEALGRAQKRGAVVRVVLSDQSPTSAQSSAITQLKAAGIPVRATSTPYIHAKAIVTDGTRAYVGSENFTVNSLANNRELGLIVAKKTEVDKIAAAIAADFTAGTAL